MEFFINIQEIILKILKILHLITVQHHINIKRNVTATDGTLPTQIVISSKYISNFCTAQEKASM